MPRFSSLMLVQFLAMSIASEGVLAVRILEVLVKTSTLGGWGVMAWGNVGFCERFLELSGKCKELLETLMGLIMMVSVLRSSSMGVRIILTTVLQYRFQSLFFNGRRSGSGCNEIS
jgi:hypothetical protein